jgi:hypothetical protein
MRDNQREFYTTPRRETVPLRERAPPHSTRINEKGKKSENPIALFYETIPLLPTTQEES